MASSYIKNGNRSYCYTDFNIQITREEMRGARYNAGPSWDEEQDTWSNRDDDDDEDDEILITSSRNS